MNNTVTSAAPAGPTRKSRFKRFLGFLSLVCITLAAAYLAGYLTGRAEVTSLRGQLHAERTAAQANLAQLKVQLESQKRQSLTLEARRNLDQAVTAIDARNFGIAEQQVKNAARLLVSAGAEAKLADLAHTLESFRLTATEDLGPQRKQLADWVSQLDQLITAPGL